MNSSMVKSTSTSQQHSHWKKYTANKQCLNKKIIAVTGAGDGIGRTLALSFARHGATVILIGRTVEKLEAVYDEIDKHQSPQAAIIPIDLEYANDDAYKKLADSIEAEFGQLDGLVHNAAVLGERTSIASYSLNTWNSVMQVNVNAPFALSKHCLPLLHKSPSASIIFTSSGVGAKGRAYWGAYAASKAAIENLSQTLADELEDTSQIRVNTINPGATRTSMRAQAFPAEDPNTVKPISTLIPLFLYFMSNDSKHTTGQHVSF